MDAAILNRAPFKRRIIAFIRQEVMENFLNRCDGLVDLSSVELLVCETCPAEMLAEIAEIQDSAKSEIGTKGKIWKASGPRR